LTYSDNIQKENVEIILSAVLKPRRILTGLTSQTPPSSPVTLSHFYQATFDYGVVDSITFNGQTELYLTFPRVAFNLNYAGATSANLSDGWWYFNETTNTISIDAQQDPTDDIIIVTYKLFVSTRDMYWYDIPTNSSTQTRFYEGIVSSSPSNISSVDDFILGFTQSSSASLVMNNTGKSLNRHFYDSSWSNASIDLYHTVGTLSTSNTKLFFKGISRNYTISDDQISLSVLDANIFFDQTYTINVLTDVNKYKNNVFLDGRSSSANPISAPELSIWNAPGEDSINAFFRDVYGEVFNLNPLNINPVFDNPTTSTNRRHLVGRVITENPGNINGERFSFTVNHTALNTTTRTFFSSSTDLDDIAPLKVGDHIEIEVSGTGEGVTVTAINNSSKYIDHTALSSSVHLSGDTIKAPPFIRRVRAYMSETKTVYDLTWDTNATAMYEVVGFNVDYNIPVSPSSQQIYQVFAIKLATTFEGDLGLTTAFNPQNDYLIVDCYNDKTNKIFTTSTDNEQDSAAAFKYLLKTNLRLTNVDDAAFDAITSYNNDKIGFTIPETYKSPMPTYKEIMNRLATTGLFKWYLNSDNNWTATRIQPVVTASKTIKDDEIIGGSISAEVSYGDVINGLTLYYGQRDIDTAFLLKSNFYDLFVVADNRRAKYLHNVDRTIELTCYFNNQTQAQALADKIVLILGERKMLTRIINKYRAFDSSVDDYIIISRDSLPGFEYVAGTLQSRDYVIQSINKSIDQIEIILDDQKAVEDNSGSF
jgi:hypothetical protein